MANSSSVPLEHLLAHRAWVRALARTLVRNEAGAEDLEQQVWVEALERPPSHGRSLRGWFATVLRRRARDARRGEGRRAERETAVARAGVWRPTAELVAEAEAQRRVVEALHSLPVLHRDLLLLRFFEDLSPAAIALREGVPRETVKTRLRRARAALRERLEEGSGAGGAWRAALLPLLGNGQGDSGAGAAAVTGGLIMGASTKAAVGASLLVLLGLGWWAVGEKGGEESTGAPHPDGKVIIESPGEGSTLPEGDAGFRVAATDPPVPFPDDSPPVKPPDPSTIPAPGLDRERLPQVVEVRTLPEGAMRVEVEVDAKGRVTVGGEETDMAALLVLLKERADALREEDPPRCSLVNAILRVDRDLPWQAGQWLMQACADPGVRMDRIHYAAVPATGGEEGVLPTFIPRDPGVAVGEESGLLEEEEGAAPPPPGKRLPEPVSMIRVRLAFAESGSPAAVRDIHPWIERRFPNLRTSAFTVEIAADPSVPAGEVLATVDAMLRAGVEAVLFRGSALFKEGTLEEAIAALRPIGTVLDIRVNGESIAER